MKVEPGDLVVVQTPSSRFGPGELKLMRVLTTKRSLPRTLGHLGAQVGDRGVPFGKMACERLWLVRRVRDDLPVAQHDYDFARREVQWVDRQCNREIFEKSDTLVLGGWLKLIALEVEGRQ